MRRIDAETVSIRLQRVLEAVVDALRLTVDYSKLPRDEFMQRWQLRDNRGQLGRPPAASYAPYGGMACVAARVAVVFVPCRTHSKPEYPDPRRCERWKVILPELIFAPDPEKHGHKAFRARKFRPARRKSASKLLFWL